MGETSFKQGSYKKAFDHFTNVLKRNENNVEALTKRAFIHYELDEFEECVIECEEIIKNMSSPDVIELMKKGKKEIPPKHEWCKVLNVPKDASKSAVKEAYYTLARKFSTNSSKNSKLLQVDKKKADAKMAKINEAWFGFHKL